MGECYHHVSGPISPPSGVTVSDKKSTLTITVATGENRPAAFHPPFTLHPLHAPLTGESGFSPRCVGFFTPSDLDSGRIHCDIEVGAPASHSIDDHGHCQTMET